MENINVLCSTDDKFAQHCAVMATSLLRHTESSVTIHVIESKLSTDNQQKLKETVITNGGEIIFHHVGEDYAKLLQVIDGCAVSDAAYYRFYVTSLIEDESIEKVLYLDCDIVVMDDVARLFQIDMTDYPLGAVRDIVNPANEKQMFGISFSYRDRYFNSGVLLINLKLWRQNNYQEQLIQKARQINSFIFPDQDPLNAVFRNKWLELPPWWNRFSLVKYADVYFRNKADELRYIYSPSIIHYANNIARPWMDMKFVPWRKAYEETLVMTPWKGTKQVKVEKKSKYKSLFLIICSNVLYRYPAILRFTLLLPCDSLLFIYHIIKNKGLKFYKSLL